MRSRRAVGMYTNILEEKGKTLEDSPRQGKTLDEIKAEELDFARKVIKRRIGFDQNFQR